MNKLTIVAKNPRTYFIKRLIEEVGQEQVQLFNPWIDAIPAMFGKILFRSSGVYQDDRDLDLVRQSGAQVMNPLPCLETFRSKSSQYQFFNDHSHPSFSWCWLKDWQEASGEFLVKPDRGQGGWGIQVFGPGALRQWRSEQEKKGDHSWIVQPYKKGKEFRIFFVGSERLTLERSASATGVAANFAQDGAARLVPLPSHLQAITEKLISDSGAYYGAIDMLDLSHGPVFLELNVVPGIEQLEILSGRNIIQILLSANFFCHKAKV